MATVNFSEQVNNFATRVGAECKRISNTIGALSSLNTSDKTSVVSAIAEVKTATNTLQNTLNGFSSELGGVKTQQATNTGDISTLKSSVSTLQTNLQALQEEVDSIEGVLESQSEIDDSKVSTVSTYSSSKVESVVATAKQAVKDEILGGAGTAFDTLKELADLISANSDLIQSLTDLASKGEMVSVFASVARISAMVEIGVGAPQ